MLLIVGARAPWLPRAAHLETLTRLATLARHPILASHTSRVVAQLVKRSLSQLWKVSPMALSGILSRVASQACGASLHLGGSECRTVKLWCRSGTLHLSHRLRAAGGGRCHTTDDSCSSRQVKSDLVDGR